MLATFQVMVCIEPSCQVVAEFCELTVNGPEVAVTVINVLSSSVHPHVPSYRSLTVTLNSMSLVTEGNSSQVGFVPFMMLVILGKYLVGDAVGSRLLNIGPTTLVDTGGMTAPTSGSHCSQQYVIGLLSASVAEAVKTNGVDIGIV